MSRRFLPRLLGTVALSVLAVGCSGGDGETAVEEKQSVEVEVFSWWVAPGEAEALLALFDSHRDQYPDERIFNAPEASGPTAKQVLGERLDAGEPPDLFQQNGYEMAALVASHPGRIQ